MENNNHAVSMDELQKPEEELYNWVLLQMILSCDSLVKRDACVYIRVERECKNYYEET